MAKAPRKVPRTTDHYVDLARLGEVDWMQLSEFEKIALGNPDRWNWRRVLQEVRNDPTLARLKLENDATLLHYAANDRQPTLVKLLLLYGADVNAYETVDGTPLHSAAKGGNIQIVRSLLKRGAMVEVKDARGLTPLYWACINHNDEVVKVLLGSGALPEDDYSVRYVASLRSHGLL